MSQIPFEGGPKSLQDPLAITDGTKDLNTIDVRVVLVLGLLWLFMSLDSMLTIVVPSSGSRLQCIRNAIYMRTKGSGTSCAHTVRVYGR